jgi:hypothetical protein
MVVCIVTIHGIGFQTPPNDDRGVPGYADALHAHLSEALGAEVLGDDPGRGNGVRGPVYVHSTWPPGSRKIEEGLDRLGSWEPNVRPARVTTDKPLVDGTQPIAHIALVYANLEEKVSALGPLGLISQMSLFRLGRYGGAFGLANMLVADGRALMGGGKACPEATPSLQPRRVVRLTPASADTQTIEIVPDPGGLRGTVITLENDVAAYVVRDELRQRVRSFVNESLMRLAYRQDVDGIIVNAHSQGTVVAFDVLRDFAVVAIDRVKALVTAGSPLRKYVQLFAWGAEIGCIYGIDNGKGRWTNFWDARDPVADPLTAPSAWHPGQPVFSQPGQDSLLHAVNKETGQVLDYSRLADRPLNNLTFSCGGGLQAHNYWDNTAQFIPEFVKIVRSTAGLPD